MRTFMTTHRVNIAVAMWWYLVIGGAGLSAVEEAAAIENAKAIKIEKTAHADPHLRTRVGIRVADPEIYARL